MESGIQNNSGYRIFILTTYELMGNVFNALSAVPTTLRQSIYCDCLFGNSRLWEATANTVGPIFNYNH
jgi:hypothetical protein